MATATLGRKTKRRRGLSFLWLTQKEGKIKFLAFTVAIVEGREEKLGLSNQSVCRTYPGLADLFYLEQMALPVI